ncbi:MAG: hypothetical protein V1838_01370 [Patescibacteria group bacterium]
MPDINLLKDTTGHKEGMSKKKKKLGDDLSDPKRLSIEESEGKAPSGTWLRIKNIFKGKKDKPAEPKILSMVRKDDQAAEQDTAEPFAGGDKYFAEPLPGEKKKKTEPAEEPYEKINQVTPPTVTPSSPWETPRAPFAVPQENVPSLSTMSTPPKSTIDIRKVTDKASKPETDSEGSSPSGVNLLPEDLVGQYEPRKKLLGLLIAAGITIAVVALVYVGMIYYQSSIVSKTEELRAEATQINQEINKYNTERSAALALMQKVDLVAERLDQHVYWTKFFSLLEKYTVYDVYYASAFAGDINGQFNLSATGKDYSSVARQLLSFQQASDFIETVTITSAQQSQGLEEAGNAVSFSIQLKLIPGVFYRSSPAPGENL